MSCSREEGDKLPEYNGTHYLRGLTGLDAPQSPAAAGLRRRDPNGEHDVSKLATSRYSVDRGGQPRSRKASLSLFLPALFFFLTRQ